MRRFLLSLLVVLCAGSACKGKPQVSFDIALPGDLAADTVWFEIGGFKDASCAALAPMLAGGIPAGATVRVAFQKDDPATATIGDLAKASYAFAAVAKNQDCAILATGCTEVDVSKDDSVLVAMDPLETPTGACGAGASCQAAQCVPANDNSDPSVGAGCSLELLGSGPLANPAGGAGSYVSAPAIEPTPSGFVIVYREVDPSAATAKVTILPIDPAGGALPPARPSLGGRCANDDETDGVGLVQNATAGQLILAKPACGTVPGLELLGFDTKPEVTPEAKSHISPADGAQVVKLSDAHVAALRNGGSVLTFVADGIARASTVTAKGVTLPTGTFGAVSGNTGAWAAASDKVLALLAAGPGDPGTPLPTDAGDGGDPGTDDAGVGEGATLRLLMVPANTGLDTITAPAQPRAPVAFPGVWGAVSAVGKRVIVLSEGSGPGRSVTYRTFDLDDTEAKETNGFSIEGNAPVTTGDLALHGDRAFFVALKPGIVSLHAYAGATTSPRPLRTVNFQKESRIPAVNLVRDGRVSIAVTDTRVAVAWTTAKTLNANDPAGGYAVFACTQ